MMNILALGLVLTSLVTAGVFTPSQKPQSSKEDVIVKEGHRVVVVEYEKDDGNTKVSISPQDSQAPSHKVDEKGYFTNAKDKLSEKMEDVKERGKEASSSEEGKVGSQEEGIHHRFSPRELVCDAYGKCKHKIASAIGRTKEAIKEEAQEAAEKVHEEEKEVKEAVSEATDKDKAQVTDTAPKASDKIQEAKESVRDSASEVSSKAKDKVAEKASEMKEGAKQRVYDVIDATKKVKEEAERDATKKMEGTKEKLAEKAKEAEELVQNASDRAHRVNREGQKELREILRRAGELAVDIFDYVLPPERVASLTGVLHLMGFAAAYGMCLWITFASSYVLAGALARQQFAMVQSKIYPVYFKAMGYGVGMASLGHLMSPRKRLPPGSAGMFQGFNLMASLVMILVNLLCLEPRATKVMFERMKKEKEEGKGKEGQATEPSGQVVNSAAETAGRGSTGGMTTKDKPEAAAAAAAAKTQILRLTENLQRLNSYSSFLNVLTLMCLTWHLVQLGQHLHAAC